MGAKYEESSKRTACGVSSTGAVHSCTPKTGESSSVNRTDRNRILYTKMDGNTRIWKRLKRTISRIWQWCRNNRHEPLKEQYRMLCLKLRGHYQYYGIRGNYRCLELLLWKAIRAWRYWLSRRSSKSYIQWEKFLRILARYPLPAPRIVHCI